MSFHTFFGFAAGIAKPIKCPKGTLDGIMRHVAEVEREVGIAPEVYNGDKRWCRFEMDKCVAKMDDEVLCRVAEGHNSWVRWLYGRMGEWSSNPPNKDSEKITPALAKEFWHALDFIEVPCERWTADYFRARMESAYETLRGRDGREGVTFDAKPLTPEQADAVLSVFSFLDTHDIRLAVPNGHDFLKASHDGGYEWCATCGAIDSGDFHHKLLTCRKRGCDLKDQNQDELQDLRMR